MVPALKMKLRIDTSKPSKRGPGRPPSGMAPSKKDLLRLYVREGKPIREVAEALGVSKDMVYRALKSHGIEARTNVKRSGLRKHSMKVLKEEVQKKGVRGMARGLEVSHSALSRFLRAEEEK